MCLWRVPAFQAAARCCYLESATFLAGARKQTRLPNFTIRLQDGFALRH